MEAQANIAEGLRAPGGKHRRSAEPWPRESSYVEKALGLSLLFVLIVGCASVVAPFFSAVLLAMTLCVSTWPLFIRLRSALGGRTALAAAAMTGMAVLLLVLPLVALGANLADDLSRLAGTARAAVERGLPPPPWLARVPVAGPEATRIWNEAVAGGQELRTVLAPYVKPVRDWALRESGTVISATFQVAFAVVIAFFLYRDGRHVEGRLEWAMSRLGGWRGRHVLGAAGRTITGVVSGVLGTSLVQGVLLGASFWAAGLPGAMVLGVLAMLLSLVPMGLTALWLPAGLWLMSEDRTITAIALMAFNGLLVGTLDNVLRPYLISRGIRMPMVLIVLGVFGGLITFGLVGVVIGPVLFAIAHTLFQDWDREIDVATDGEVT